MAADQVADVEPGDFAVFDDPTAADHDPVGAMRAAENERGDGIAAAGKAQLVELEQSEIGQPPTAMAPISLRPTQAAEPWSPSAARPGG